MIVKTSGMGAGRAFALGGAVLFFLGQQQTADNGTGAVADARGTERRVVVKWAAGRAGRDCLE